MVEIIYENVDEDIYSDEITDTQFLQLVITIPNFINNIFVQGKLKQYILNNILNTNRVTNNNLFLN